MPFRQWRTMAGGTGRGVLSCFVSLHVPLFSDEWLMIRLKNILTYFVNSAIRFNMCRDFHHGFAAFSKLPAAGKSLL
jgi:hypothetical protein